MMALIRLKMAVFAPMPSAKEITATAVKPGLFCIKRNANRTSCGIMVALYVGPKRQSTILEAAHVEIVLQTIVWTTFIMMRVDIRKNNFSIFNGEILLSSY